MTWILLVLVGVCLTPFMLAYAVQWAYMRGLRNPDGEQPAGSCGVSSHFDHGDHHD